MNYQRIEKVDQNFFQSLASIYMSSANEVILTLEQAVQERDMSRIQFCAHKIKSSSCLVGASYVEQTARTIELSLEKGEGIEMGLVHKLIYYIREFLTELNVYLNAK